MILAPDVTDCINEAGCIGGACRVGVAGRVSSEDWCSIISSDSVAYTLMTVLSPWKREGSILDISSVLLSSVISLSFLLGKLPNFFLNNFFYFHCCLPSCESCRSLTLWHCNERWGTETPVQEPALPSNWALFLPAEPSARWNDFFLAKLILSLVSTGMVQVWYGSGDVSA
jgi:hypothetical protein